MPEFFFQTLARLFHQHEKRGSVLIHLFRSAPQRLGLSQPNLLPSRQKFGPSRAQSGIYLPKKSLFEGFLTDEDDMTCQPIGVLGPLPPEWQRKWDAHRDQLQKSGQPIDQSQSLNQPWEVRFETCVQRPRIEEKMTALEASERDALSSLLRSMLSFRPEDRPSAQQNLESEWMVKWALPEYEKIRRTK